MRVEDTDVERNLEGSLDRILRDLSWAGLEWDEGPDRGGPFAPYLQSERTNRHFERALELRAGGLAYPCFCSGARIEASRADGRETPGCPGGCRDLNEEEAAELEQNAEADVAIRFAVPDEVIEVIDEIRGPITFQGSDIRDFVILRADRRSTYNFAVVVDDADMEITHVIRGAGHLSNTPKQALLFDALGTTRPVFAHLPTVLGASGARLSKRTGSPGISTLEEEGVHPDALVNYLSLLGWSPGDDREVMSVDEIVGALDLNRVGSSNTVYDLEKLRWMSAQHIARMPLDSLVTSVRPYVDRERFPLEESSIEPAVDAVRSRLRVFGEINTYLTMIFPDDDTIGAARQELREGGEASRSVLRTVRERLAGLRAWNAATASGAVKEAGRELQVTGPGLFHPVRLGLCGSKSGPDLGRVMEALGRDRTLSLLEGAAASFSA